MASRCGPIVLPANCAKNERPILFNFALDKVWEERKMEVCWDSYARGMGLWKKRVLRIIRRCCTARCIC